MFGIRPDPCLQLAGMRRMEPAAAVNERFCTCATSVMWKQTGTAFSFGRTRWNGFSRCASSRALNALNFIVPVSSFASFSFLSFVGVLLLGMRVIVSAIVVLASLSTPRVASDWQQSGPQQGDAGFVARMNAPMTRPSSAAFSSAGSAATSGEQHVVASRSAKV